MADALDLGSSVSRRAGSSPAIRTNKRTRIVIREICHNFFVFRVKIGKITGVQVSPIRNLPYF